MKQKQESSKQRTYPNLFKKFAYENFNVIVEAVEKQFSTLFNLSVLEEAAGDEILSSEPYFCWFSSLLPYLKEKRTEDEIVAELAFQLNNDICMEFYKGKFLFVADKKGVQGNQLGELERSLSGKATRPVEPFSFLDIIRLVGRTKPKETNESESSSKASSSQRVRFQRPEKEKKIGVFSLTHLHSIHGIKQEKPEAKGLEGFTGLIININRNPQDVPKWVSVEFDNKKGTIFCEARLLDSEKDEIENIINPYVDSLVYDPNGGKADGGISSGHVAVRRLGSSAVSSEVKEEKENFWVLCHQLRMGVLKAETGKFETKYFSEDMAFVSSQMVPDQNRKGLLRFLEDFFTYTGFYRHDINLTAKKMAEDLNNQWKGDPNGYSNYIDEKVYEEDPFCTANKGVSGPFFINAIEKAPNHTVQMNDLAWHDKHTFSDTVVQVFNASQNFKEVTIVAEGTTEETIPDPDPERQKKGYKTNIFKAKAATSGKKNILSPEQFGYLTEAMEYNTHVEKFSVQLTQEKNESIDELNLQFSPRLARNRWLNANQYCQPLMGNHWRFAVKKWLNYLLDHPGVLSGETGSSVRFFKEVVEGMGVLGLKEFLSYLSQERSLVEKMLGGTGLPFYAACPAYEMNAYTEALKEHLERREYFPFESLGFRYAKGNTEALLDLLSGLNRVSQVGTIHVMVSAEERKSTVFHNFLKTLGRRTADEQWTTVLVVEGLSGGVCPTEEQDLRNTYRHVNNMILEHRRGQKAAKLVESVRGKIYVEKLTNTQANRLLTTTLSSLPSSSSSASSAFSAASSDFSSSSSSSSSSSYLDHGAKQIIHPTISLSTTSVKPIGKKWPLQGGGAVQLQVQQQQQVQQQRQVHQQHKLTRTVLMDELPAETDLVNYDTVEAVFGAHYQELLKQFPEMNSSSLPIQREGATFLQNFFETCIGADPKVKARYVIRHMTKEAFTTLLRNYRQLSSGFNPEDQWPKGFYMQWNRLGEAILCYHPELGYLKEPTPLTLQLRRRMPAAVAWEGDFRQFDFAHYLKQGKVVVDQKALELMASFAALQPGTPWPTFDQFLIDHPNLKTLLGPKQEKVTEYWPIFYQAYQYAGETGLNACLTASALPRSDAQKALTLLFASDTEVLLLIERLGLDKTHAVALGQLYYALGKDSVKVFLTQMNALRNRLGSAFFSKFRERFLTPCENFSGFFTTSCFETLNQMIDALTENAYPEIGELWDRISQAHVAAVGLESPEVLWKGFWYFMEGLSAEGVTLSGASLRKLSNANGLIWMHRVLACVQRIPEQDEKALFLGKLNDFALKYGDLPYAVERDGIRRPTKEGLRLVNFEMAKPTYAPSLEGVFSWTEDELDVLTQRALATTPFEPNEHRALSAYFEELSKDTTRPKETIPALLTSVLLTSNPATSTSAVEFLKVLEGSSLLTSVAKVLHEAVYAKRGVKLAVSVSCLSALLTHLDFTQAAWNSIPVDYRPLFLESVMLLHNRGAMGDLKGLLALVQTSFEPAVEVSAEKLVETAETNNPTSSAEVVKSDEENEKKAAQKAYSLKLVRGSVRLAALFGEYRREKVGDFLEATKNLVSVYRGEQILLSFVEQVCLVNWLASDVKALGKEAHFTALTEHAGFAKYIEAIEKAPWDAEALPKTFLGWLKERGVVFQSTQHGEMRSLLDSDLDEMAKELGVFVGHQVQVRRFLQAHVAVPKDKSVKESLGPLLGWLKQLQLRQGEANEVVLVISALMTYQKESDQKAKRGIESRYWSVDDLYGLLTGLHTEEQRVYPVSILKRVLDEASLKPKGMEALRGNFPVMLKETWQQVLSAKVLTREQQGQLCQLATKEYAEKETVTFTQAVLGELVREHYSKDLRGHALGLLLLYKNMEERQKAWVSAERLLRLEVINEKVVTEEWQTTCSLWLRHLKAEPVRQALGALCQVSDKERRGLLLMIAAFAGLRKGLLSERAYTVQLERKLSKLVEMLMRYSVLELRQIVACYPQLPCPQAGDLLRLDKGLSEDFSLAKGLEVFGVNPHGKLRTDYGRLSVMRKQDLSRMLRDSRVVRGVLKEPLSSEAMKRFGLLFSYLKRLETGDVKLKDLSESVKKMTQAQLRSVFDGYQGKQEKDLPDEERMQLWAVVFEVIERTTTKYENLGQVFALLGGEATLEGTRQGYKVATGEGKTILMLAMVLRDLALGKKAHVYTATQALAERDREENAPAIAYVGRRSTNLSVKSGPETLPTHDVVYGVLGELPLHLAYCAYELNQPVTTDFENCVGYFDEFDFIRFDEGTRTAYNFAVDAGKAPEQMRWFYRAVNGFYVLHRERLKAHEGIDESADIEAFIAFMEKEAGEHVYRQEQVEVLKRTPLEAIRWIQAAHDADGLERGVQFALLEGAISVGEETYDMHEIVPLSMNNQKMRGSSYSEGVDQLKAELLNETMKESPEPCTVHLRRESDILSSQVAVTQMELYPSWKVFSGSFSTRQAERLYEENGMMIFEVPTNQACLREWKPIVFCETEDSRFDWIVKTIEDCLKKKESFLLACPDDKTVDQLINKLKIRLKHEDFNQLLPFTSESQLSVTDLLGKKHELEDWQHGQAQKSVGLIASSLSRGLNLQIRRSISLALQTETEELQTAGRAARQGEAGSVERAYVWPQVKKAHQELLQHAKRYDAKIEEVLAKVRGSDPSGGRDDKTGVYRELLYLKEYVSELQTQAQTRYQEAVSDYSGWVMIALGELGRLGLQEEKETLKRLWLEEFADVRRVWMVISSDETLAPLEKGKAIREKIQQRSTGFVNRCASEVKSWKTLGLSDFKGPRVRDAQKHTSPVAAAPEAPEVLEACVSAVLSEISSTSATSNDKFLADFSTKLELLSPVLQKNIQADQTFLALSKSYTTDPDTRFKFLVLLHESVSVMEGKRETRLRWLSQCEGLLCHSQGTDKAADGHFLMHVCEVMKGSLDEATELKLGRFLKETESFWGKLPRGRYEKLLRSFWEQLATQVTRTQGGEAIRRLPSEALGELAFKWPLEYWQLSSETLSVHWPFLAQVMELLGTLKAGSKIKKLLFDQVVAFLKDSPKEFRFEKGYLEQTLAFFARPENKQRVVNGQMIAELKYALSTGEGEEMTFRRHLFQLMLQEPLTASWKLKEFDAYFEKLNPLLAVESGLRDKRMIWKKGTILIRDFEQSMALVNALSVYPQSYVLLQSDEGSAFLRFLRLTQDYKEYFSGGAKLYDFLFKDRLNVKNRLSQCELCCTLLKTGAFRVDEMANLYGAMEMHPLFTAERLPSLLLVLKQHPQLGRELMDLLLPQPELSLEAMAFLVEQWVQFDEALRRCLLPQEWVQKTKVLFSQLLTEKRTALILALMQYPQKAQWLITDLFLVNLTNLEVDQFTHFINQLMSLYQALEKCALTNDAKLKIKNDFVNLTPEKRAVFFMAMEQYPQKAAKIMADFSFLNTFPEDQINLLINQLMRLQEVTDRCLLQKDIKKLFLELSVEKRAEFISLIEGHPQQVEQLLIDLVVLNLQLSQWISLGRELLKLYQLLDKSLLSKDLNQKIKDVFLSLESKEKRSAFLHFIQRYEKVFESNTNLVPIVVKHFGGVGSDALQQVEVICKLVGEKKQEKEIVEKISATVFLLKNKEAQKLDELITKYPEHAMLLLTDGVVSYCLQEEGTSPYLMQVTTLFYQLLKENDEDVSSLMVDERVKEWFNFESENSVYQKKRQIWMRLLYQGIWISSKEEKLWTEEKNAELLEKGFDQYTHFAEKILSKEKTQNTGDLTLDQQTKLLHLSQELQAIQSPIQKNITVKKGVLHDSAGHINDLKKEADIVIRQYASIWKTPDRTNQLQKFQKDWESTIMAQTDKSRYENVLVVIEKAKREVINADKEANKRSWLKKNRKGYSHYLNTLDRLYNLVSTHWARDLEAIGAFSQHEQKFVERFHQSLEALRITFSTSEEKEFAVLYHLLNETQQLLLEGEEVESKKATRNINQSVDGSENDDQIEDEEDETDINQDKKLPAFVTERRKTLLHAQLEHDLPKLPGHLATLARMALSQAEALSLSKQDPVENNLRQLLIELYKKIDAYEMDSDRSNERKASVAKLKQVLIKAMLTDKSHENLLSEIETIKMGVIDRDNQVNEEILFWKVNRKGHSDYLRLLSDLENHIVTHWVANDRDAQVQRQDTKQLQKRFSSLTAKLLSAAEAFVKEERSLVQKITSGVFSQGADLFALVNVLKQVNLATDSKLLNELLDRLGDSSFFPGEICALADQVVKIGQELKLHITARPDLSF